MSVKFNKVQNAFDQFVADEYKTGEQIQATLTVNGKEFSGMGSTREAALEDLQERVNAHSNAQKYVAQTEIKKANGEYFFD